MELGSVSIPDASIGRVIGRMSTNVSKNASGGLIH